jgi:hypothetical protein
MAAIALFVATTASATIVVDATRDNWMRNSEAWAGTNFDASPVILVTPPGNNTTHTLVGFDNLPALVGAEVISATLRMERQLNQNMDVEVRAVVLPAGIDWTETGSNWANYNGAGTPWPGGGGGLADTSALLDTQYTTPNQQYDDWDVTSAVRDWLDGNTQNNGFLLNSISGGTGNDVRWAQRLHATLDPPRLIIEADLGPPATVFTWEADDDGNWANSASWSFSGPASQGVANDPSHTAIFGNAITTATTAVTNAGVTVNRIDFDNATNSYAVAGLGSVNLAFDPDDPNDPNDPTGNPAVNVVAGSHQFQVEVNLIDSTDVTAGDNTTLEFHNTIDLGGNNLTIAPATGGLENGVVVLNTSITGSGNVSNSATLSTGLAASLGTGDFSSTGTLDFDITPNSAGLFLVSGTATLDGSVNVDFLDGAAPAGTTTLLTAGSPIVLPSGLPSLSFTGASGLSLALSGDSMSLLLNSSSNPVDADGSGFIDGADFLILQRTNPSLIAQWELQYGMPAAASGGLAAVPEPSSILLLNLGALVALGCRRSRAAT